MAQGTFQAKDYVVVGAGYGVLKYNGKTIDLIQQFQDQGQQPKGETVEVMAIQDTSPRGFITPLAQQGGTINFKVFVKRGDGFFAGLLDDRYAGAQNLAQLFRDQLSDGPVQVVYSLVDVPGATSYAIAYNNVTITSAVRSFTVSTNGGNAQVVFDVTAKYTDTQLVSA